jgi:cell division protein FtsZ
MPEVAPAIETFARIKVVGVGGAGGAAVNRMVEAGIDGVEFIAVNTDAQALHFNNAQVKVHIGRDTTKGLGSGADPSVGKKAAEESAEDLKSVLAGADMIFVTFGAGGGTGSGAGPMIAKIAREMDILVVGIATKPFAFEGEKRRRNAEEAIDGLTNSVDTLITIPNDRLLQTIDRKTPLTDAFKIADDVLRQGVQGISDLITIHGLINLDFADVKTIMQNAGSALMGIGRASGENRAIEAAMAAIESPLLEVSIDGARGVLFNVTGGLDMSMHEINEAAETITGAVDPDANIIFGATLNPNFNEEIAITVIATGFEASYLSSRIGGSQTASALLKELESQSSASDSQATEQPKFTPSTTYKPATEIDEAELEKVDMDLSNKKDEAAKEFQADDGSGATSIWSYDKEEEGKFDKPSFLRKGIFNRNKNQSESGDNSSTEVDK